MRKINILCGLLVLAMFAHCRSFAQNATNTQEPARTPEPPAHYYHLQFVVQEVAADGKPVNSRSYSATASTARSEGTVSVRTGSRIPIVTGSPSLPENERIKQFQYMDVGVNIDSREVREVDGMLSIHLSAEISSLATPAGLSEPSNPVIRQTRWQAPVLIPIRKPTVVFTSDDLDSKGSTQLVITATPVE